MKNTKKVNNEKLKYNRIVRLAKRAEKQAMKFIKKNIKLDPQLRPGYHSI
ncbi:hypothetical protein HYW54_03650 [Candidatus Gottesmanbacteria bacterium]|nr:hypothetical protein [Candidatus Gottesmanbacteria bacterium]